VLDFFIALLKDMALESFKYGDAIITYGTIHFKLINLSSIFKAKWETKYTWFWQDLQTFTFKDPMKTLEMI
jgi:hypothetical protein